MAGGDNLLRGSRIPDASRLQRGLIALLIGLGACGGPAPADYSRTPVLLVHGHGMNAATTWSSLVRYLGDHGYPPEYIGAVDLVPSNGGNVAAAEAQIAPAVDTLLARANAALQQRLPGSPPFTRIDIVAHSMGALSSRWYVVREHPERIRTWVALAGANHGTNYFCPPRDDGTDDMCPAYAITTEESAIQVELNGTPAMPRDESPWGVGADRADVTRVEPTPDRSIRYYTVQSSQEAFIQPESSARLDGTGGDHAPIDDPNVRELTSGTFLVGGTNHDDVTSRPAAVLLIEALLRGRPATRQ